MKTLHTRSPQNGEVLQEYPVSSAKEVANWIDSVAKVQRSWRRSSHHERSLVLQKLAKILRAGRAAYAQIIHVEMGKTLAEAEAEVEKCASCADFYAEKSEEFLRTVEVESSAKRSFVAFEPLGIVYAIMPWNFPFWQAFRAAIPAIAAGNGIILKHASNVTGCALTMEKIWLEATDGKQLFRTIVVPGNEASHWISHPAISAVSFTGSTPVGKAIAAEAGRQVKKCVLELGGSDPFIVLADADLNLAAKLAAKSRLLNSGQSCISAKRFIVHTKVYREFLALFAETLQTEIAPLARADLREDLHQQVSRAVEEGAELMLGGKISAGKGYFYPPTILAGIKESMTIFREETFGPVASVIEAADTSEAIRLANSTSFGLGAALFTKDEARGIEILQKEIEAGSCFLNDFVRSDSRLPFGGVKESGYGRELSSFGIREFVNTKTIVAN